MTSAEPIINELFNGYMAKYRGWNLRKRWNQWLTDRDTRRLTAELARTTPTERGLHQAYALGLMSKGQEESYRANTLFPPIDRPRGWLYSLCGHCYCSMPNHQ